MYDNINNNEMGNVINITSKIKITSKNDSISIIDDY